MFCTGIGCGSIFTVMRRSNVSRWRRGVDTLVVTVRSTTNTNAHMPTKRKHNHVHPRTRPPTLRPLVSYHVFAFYVFFVYIVPTSDDGVQARDTRRQTTSVSSRLPRLFLVMSVIKAYLLFLSMPRRQRSRGVGPPWLGRVAQLGLAGAACAGAISGCSAVRGCASARCSFCRLRTVLPVLFCLCVSVCFLFCSCFLLVCILQKRSPG